MKNTSGAKGVPSAPLGKLMYEKISELQKSTDNSLTKFAGMKAFKPAKIYAGGKDSHSLEREWFVYYSLRDENGNFKREKSFGNLNSYKTIGERQAAANRLRDSINEILGIFEKWIKNNAVQRWNESVYGWLVGDRFYTTFDLYALFMSRLNPDASREENTKPLSPVAGLKHMTLCEGLQWALEVKRPDYAPNSYADRKTIISQVENAVKALGIDIPLPEVELMHLSLALNKISADRSLSPVRYNAFLETTKTMMGVLVGNGILKYNPSSAIKRKKEKEPTAHTKPTKEEIEAIFSTLNQKHYPLSLLSTHIYERGIRPCELRALKISDCHSNEMEIIITSQGAKGGYGRIVPMLPWLMEDLMKFVVGYPRDFYVFGKDLLPGPKPSGEDVANRLWRQLIKEDLKINRTMYSLKAAGADKMLEEGYPITDVQYLFGHQTVEMTRIYAKAEKRLIIERLKGSSKRVINQVNSLAVDKNK